jgi:drug/metabolite transporter (DMT)-like permease
MTPQMTTQTEKEKTKECGSGPFTFVFGQRKQQSLALFLAVLGCLAVGVVGILKALSANNPAGVLMCLLGSVAGFGAVIYVRLRKQ